MLVLFFGLLVPVMVKVKVIPKMQTKPELHKKHIALIASLLVASVVCVGAYCEFYLPTQSVSQSVTKENLKLTLKSDQRGYKINKANPDAPLSLTATLKNTSTTDEIDISYGYTWCDIKLVHKDGIVIPSQKFDDEENSMVIAPEKNIKFNDTFAWEWEQMGALPRGKYTAVAEVEITVDGEPVSLEVELPIKIK